MELNRSLQIRYSFGGVIHLLFPFLLWDDFGWLLCSPTTTLSCSLAVEGCGLLAVFSPLT
jgi:hypothetical protein